MTNTAGTGAQEQGAPLEGRYANYVKLGHNALEFILDFGQLYNGGNVAHVHTRIIASPFFAKELLQMLKESIRQHEAEFGPLERSEN